VQYYQRPNKSQLKIPTQSKQKNQPQEKSLKLEIVVGVNFGVCLGLLYGIWGLLVLW
jgi:hypothetical protein